MKRKVNLVGQNTLTVSLPSKWVKDNKIQKGDELDVEAEASALVLSKKALAKQKKTITINAENYNYLSLARHLYLLYRANYSKITITYDKSTIYYNKKEQELAIKDVVSKILNRFVGAEITAQTGNKIEIECFTSEEKPDLDKIEKRIRFLMKETTDNMLLAIGPDYGKFNEIAYDQHDIITKFINYFLKTLYNSDRDDEEKKAAYSFYMCLDNITDKIRHLSEKINEYGCSAKVKKYLSEIFSLFYQQFDFLSNPKLSREVIDRRYDLKKKIDKEKLTADELRVLKEAAPFLDTINYFAEYSIIKEILDEKDKPDNI